MGVRDFLFGSTSNSARKLQDSFRRIEQIALEEWVPTLSPHGESHAGYPHTRSVEREIDKLLDPILRPGGDGAGLSETEAYVLLAAVQLHDIGRAKGPQEHGKTSAQIINNYGVQLGLVSDKHLIWCVAKLCECHDLREDKIKGRLEEVRRRQLTIEGHGGVRSAALAAVLILGDEMDESYLRATPGYLGREQAKDPVLQLARELQAGRLRRRIASTEADAIGACLVSVVGVDHGTANRSGDGKIRAAAKALDESDDDTNTLVAGLVERVAIIQSLGALYCEAEKLCQGWPTLEGAGWPGVEKPVQDHIKKTRGHIKKMSRPIETLMEDLKTALTGEYKAIRSDNKNVYGLAILCGLLKELRKKNEKLEALRDFLRPLGLNYQEWLLEFEGVLRDADWKEQYEPGLNRIEIQSVGQAMEVLANRIFGRTEFSYAELTAEARVTSVDVVRRIVRRLALWQGDVQTKKTKKAKKRKKMAKRTKNEKCSLILEPNGWLLLKGNPTALVDTMK